MTDITPYLTRLESAGLVRVAQLEPELEYLFRHALVQDATYQSILRQDRKTLHQTVGAALEKLYPDRAEELAPQLAGHFDEAGDDERALRYYHLAGDSALRRYATAEATMMYHHAIDIARRTKASHDVMLHLYSSQGRALELSAHYDEALAHYEDLEKLGVDLGDDSLTLASLTSRATMHSTYTPLYNPERGIELSARALAVAEKLGDEKAQAKIHWNLLLVYRSSGDVERALEHSQKSLEIARRLKLDEELAFVLNDSMILQMSTGNIDAALAVAEESRAMWRAMGNRAMLADNLTTSSEILGLVGRVKEGIALSREAAEISRSIGNVWGEAYALMSEGFAHAYTGHLGEAIPLLETSIRLAETVGFGYALVIGATNLGLMLAYLGERERARELGEKAVEDAQRLMPQAVVAGEHLLALCDAYGGDFTSADKRLALHAMPETFPDYTLKLILAGIVATIRLAEGRAEEAFATVDQALHQIPPEMPGFLLTAEPLYMRARALEALGRHDEARDDYKQVVGMAEKYDSLYRRWDALAGVARIEAALGNDKAAKSARKNARKALDALITTLENPALEATFRALPEVAAVLAAV